MQNLKYDSKQIWQWAFDNWVHPWSDFASLKAKGTTVIAEDEAGQGG